MTKSVFLRRLALLAVATTVVCLDADAAVRGTLRLTSFPPGAEVWIDGAFTGKTTPATMLVALGERHVTVKAPGGGWAPAEQSIVVTTGLNVLALTLLPELTQGPPGSPGPPGAGIPERATVEVDCDAGQVISSALLTPARNLTIFVRGVCEESITISRDNVGLIGVQGAAAGLRSTSTEQNLVSVSGARNVVLRNLSLEGGRAGLSAGYGASFEATNLDMSGVTVGVLAGDAVGYFSDCRVHDNTNSGFNLHTGASFSLHSTEVYNNVTGVSAAEGAAVEVGQNSTIRDSTQWGMFLEGGAIVHVNGATVTQNPIGLFLGWRSNATVRYSRVACNADAGIAVMIGSVLALQEGAVVEDNGTGISVAGNASAVVNAGSVVRANRGDGVSLVDTATLWIHWAGLIQDNGGWGFVATPNPTSLAFTAPSIPV